MDAKVHKYVPYIFRNFQGFSVSDIKEFHNAKHMELVLGTDETRDHLCNVCGGKLGNMHDRSGLIGYVQRVRT